MNYITGNIMGRLVNLIHGKRQRVKVYAKMVHPEQIPVRDGLVLIELPANCYIDPYQER